MNRTQQHNPRNGFTLIELLVVVSIVILLVGIVLVVTTKALRAAETSATKFLLHSVSDGLEQFHTDFGYYPPLLRDSFNSTDLNRSVLEVQPDSGAELRRHRYFSMSSVSVYLIGVGRLEPSTPGPTLDPDRHDGIAGPGIRHPGPDKSWGGALDRTKNKPTKDGRVYGPYIDLGSGDSTQPVSVLDLGPRDDDNPRFDFSTSGTDDRLDLSIPMIIDSWGTTIRYYRPHWLTRRPSNGEFTLDYVPMELLNLDTINDDFKPDKDPVISSAPFFLLSAGPNRKFAGNRPSPGDVSVDLSFDAMSLDQTNTEILNDVDDAPRQLAKMLEMIGDNIRQTP